MAEHTIKVTIANRPYRLKINSEEEEQIIRESVQHIENLFVEYEKRYAYKDFQDLLAMVSLQLANNSLSLQKQIGYRDEEMVDNLDEIDQFLSSKID
jgi:cell division protein ZapA (FtsZ GTPase activity inhibitor)